MIRADAAVHDFEPFDSFLGGPVVVRKRGFDSENLIASTD